MARPDDGRPLVAHSVSNRSVWIFLGALLIVAVLLFLVLDERRTRLDERNALSVGLDEAEPIESPTALVIPNVAAGRFFPGEASATTMPSGPPNFAATPFPRSASRVMPGVPTSPRVVQPSYVPGPPIARPPSVLDQSYMSPPQPSRPEASSPAPPASAEPADSDDGLTLARIANPSTTIPQGSLIPAVLETALDSNRGGFARAIVSRNVRGFDGTTVLIPRGSRLFGEYKSDVEQGQNRMFIQWQRLTLPNGMRVTLNSPVADPLGRSGVRARVDNHFWQRFGPALLQSTLDLGVGLATRRSDGPAIIGLPGSTQFVNQSSDSRIRPTLRVQQGAIVTVFVARDLNFTSIEP